MSELRTLKRLGEIFDKFYEKFCPRQIRGQIGDNNEMLKTTTIYITNIYVFHLNPASENKVLLYADDVEMGNDCTEVL